VLPYQMVEKIAIYPAAPKWNKHFVRDRLPARNLRLKDTFQKRKCRQLEAKIRANLALNLLANYGTSRKY
jgi:hypothetical protein